MILDIFVMQDTGICQGKGKAELQILQQFFVRIVKEILRPEFKAILANL